MDLSALLADHRDRILLECVSGSRAYGTSNETSDTDVRGVFVQPAAEFLALAQPPALVADERHNTVFYSLRRTLELLGQANPNILELLYMPDDCVRHDTPEMAVLRARRQQFITRQCIETHVGYAFSQIKKARGQNKWVNQPKPVDPPRKDDFCHVLLRAALEAGTALPARPVSLADSGVDLAHCHAARLEHAQGVYRLYHYGLTAQGVFRGDVLVPQSIPIEDEATRFVGLLLYNERAWSQSMDDHRNYWTWRRERNDNRWVAQEAGDIDYDAKNLMHTIRLLLSAESIVTHGQPIVRFEGASRELLLRVRAGRLSYAEVMGLATDLQARCIAQGATADLPEHVDAREIDRLLAELTRHWEDRNRA